MASINKTLIEKSLKKKGFRIEISDHKYYYYYHNGKKQGDIKTKVSFGSKPKYYDDYLIGFMKRQLKLRTNKQTVDLLKCPMSEEKYLEILLEQGLELD